jgi:hypothetical protein
MRVERLDIENYEGWISMELYGIIWGLGSYMCHIGSFLPTPLGSAEP